jgi:hypothetical protein
VGGDRCGNRRRHLLWLSARRRHPWVRLCRLGRADQRTTESLGRPGVAAVQARSQGGAGAGWRRGQSLCGGAVGSRRRRACRDTRASGAGEINAGDVRGPELIGGVALVLWVDGQALVAQQRRARIAVSELLVVVGHRAAHAATPTVDLVGLDAPLGVRTHRSGLEQLNGGFENFDLIGDMRDARGRRGTHRAARELLHGSAIVAEESGEAHDLYGRNRP